jgi:hypothetical protein
MPLVNISRKASTLQAYQLSTPADMVTALAYLTARGYVGSISAYMSGAVLVWQLNLQLANNSGQAMSGITNDWVVIENDSIATVVPAAKATTLYQLA